MNREIYFDCSFGQIRAAVMEEGVLCELHCEHHAEKKLTETVFLGRVEQIRPAFGAAFVDIGQPLNAFLPIEEGEKLRNGDMIIVQGAAKQATETKGLRVSRRLNLAGKWLVLIPQEQGVHVSKKVKNAELREELIRIAKEICPLDCGMIVRTASEGITQEAMEEEAQRLYAQWLDISRRAQFSRTPGILSDSPSLDMRLVRDMGSKDLARIVTNDQESFRRLQKEQSEGRIDAKTELTFYQEKDLLLFDMMSIEPQIEKALKKRVWLPCGGYLVIDDCEAMTVIDVNSGKMMLGKDTEDTAVRVNLEAAEEIARQIRLRNVGGIIVVDFIDMMDADNRIAVIERMKASVKDDRCPVKVEGITKLGLLEMTRKRTNASLSKTLRCGCTYCSSTGTLTAPEETAMRALRQVKRFIISGQRGPFVIRCAPAAASVLLSSCVELDARIYVSGTSAKHAERFEIEQIDESAPIPKGAEAIKKD